MFLKSGEKTHFRFLMVILAMAVVLALVFPVQAHRPMPEDPTPTGEESTAELRLPAISNAYTPPIFLPAIMTPSFSVSETYPIDWYGGKFTTLGGLVILDFPQGAVNYPRCQLNITTPDKTAKWYAVDFYIACTLNVGEPPYYFDKFNFPVTIQFTYAHIDVSMLDEQRLVIKEGIPLSEGLAAQNAPGIMAITDQVVDTVNKTITGKIGYTGGYYLHRGYTITDLDAGPGGVYAAASPIVYRVSSSGVLTRYLNLDEIGSASELYRSFSRFAVNPTSGEVYMALTGKYAGSAKVVYSVTPSEARAIYTIPAGEEFWSLTYGPSNDVLYLSMSRITDYWFGCAVRDIFVRVISAANGSVLGADVGINGGNFPLKDLAVDSTGRLHAIVSDRGCFPTDYDGSTLITAEGTTPLARLSQMYSGFRGVEYIAADDAGRTYLSNKSGSAISVVEGAASDVVGSMDVSAPGPLAVSGNSLYIVSNNQVTSRPTSSLNSGMWNVNLTPAASLSGSDMNMRVTGNFSRIPAHNVFYYNGARHLMHATAEYNYTGREASLTFPFVVPQPPPGNYVPLEQQSGALEFRINGVVAASSTAHAPQMPYVDFPINGNASLTVARGQWVMFQHYDLIISSQEGLFSETSSWHVLYQFNQVGEYHFQVTRQTEAPFTAVVTVTPFGLPESAQLTIDPARGGVLWASGGAFEIPPGTLPAREGGYVVTYSTANNTYNLQGNVNERSLVQRFSFSPEITSLSADLRIHIPTREAGSQQVLAFYDPAVSDPYPVESAPDPTMSTHLILTIPAGTYNTSAAAGAPTLTTAAAGQPGYFRRGLNWLGSTGLWHAVGLPNGRIETGRFVVLYNSNDCSEDYAWTLTEALEEGWNYFNGMGFTMPSELVYVKVAPWIASSSTPGVTPGIGSLFNFYLFMNNALATETLQDTAVHELMHVLQKTNATPDGRYMNPVWWEEATAIWAQYEVYPSHTGYYITDIRAGDGENFLRTPYDQWGGLGVEQMNAIMSMAVYLQSKYGNTAVLQTFINLQADWDVVTGVQQSIEKVTAKPFDQFYEEFAREYWLQTFEPVKSWTFIDNLPNSPELNAIYPKPIHDPVNALSVSDMGQLSSKMYKIYAGGGDLPESFTDAMAIGSVASIANTCTGMKFYFFDSNKNEIPDLKFEGVSDSPFDQIYYDQRLGQLTSTAPLYLLAIDSSYKYTAACSPAITLEQPTVTGVYPATVVKDQTVTITASGAGFGAEAGQVSIGGVSVTPLTWTPTSVTFSWSSGSLPRTVTVKITHKKGALSNGKPVTITN